MARTAFRPRARRAVLAAFDYLDEQAGPEVARRFLLAVEEATGELADMPRIGHLCGFARASLRRMRRWPVKGFENWAIFYVPTRDGIEVIHVVHGARDLDALFG